MGKALTPPADGTRFGRGTVICTGIRCGKRMLLGAVMLCDCGQHYSATLAHLRAGLVKSCGCLLREGTPHPNRSPESREWARTRMVEMNKSPEAREWARTPEARDRRRANAIRMNLGNRTHGLSKHPLWATYQNMMTRCYYERSNSYKNYGGRGITVAPEWRGNPAAFIAWIEQNLGPRPEDMSLDRWPDNDGNYEPGNLRWATASQQRRHQRRASVS